jgi:thioredoxin-like negative regulator of GroEL
MSSAYKPIWVILVVVAGAAAVIVVPKVMQREERVVWGVSLPKALEVGKARSKPVLVYVTASWCGPCQEMKRTTLADERVALLIHSNFEAVKMDLDANQEVAARLGATAIPFFAIVNEEGKVVRSQMGYMSADEILVWLKG